MKVNRLLEISTVHIRPSTSIWLEDHLEEPVMSPVFPPLPFVHYRLTYGWLINVPSVDLKGMGSCGFPADLKKCIREAAKEKCGWLLLDSDAPELKNLPAYREEWDKSI